jgi:hypothetical protein
MGPSRRHDRLQVWSSCDSRVRVDFRSKFGTCRPLAGAQNFKDRGAHADRETWAGFCHGPTQPVHDSGGCGCQVPTRRRRGGSGRLLCVGVPPRVADTSRNVLAEHRLNSARHVWLTAGQWCVPGLQAPLISSAATSADHATLSPAPQLRGGPRYMTCAHRTCP